MLAVPEPQKELLATLREMDQQGLKVIGLKDQDPKGSWRPLEQNRSVHLSGNVQSRTHRRQQARELAVREEKVEPSIRSTAGLLGNSLQSTHRLPGFFPTRSSARRATSRPSGSWLRRRWNDRSARSMKICLTGAAKCEWWGYASSPSDCFGSIRRASFRATRRRASSERPHGVDLKPLNFRSYVEWRQEISATLGSDFPKVSHKAHLWAMAQDVDDETDVEQAGAKNRKYWVYAPGHGADRWEEFYESGMLAIGWDDADDLSQYADKEALQQKLQELWPGSSQKNNTLACWDFAKVMEVGDVVFCKTGHQKDRRLRRCQRRLSVRRQDAVIQKHPADEVARKGNVGPP